LLAALARDDGVLLGRHLRDLRVLEDGDVEALDRLLASRATGIRRELRRAILARIGATIDEAALATAATPGR
jgi:hypothetical protein